MPFNLQNPVSDVPISPFFIWQQFVNRFGLSTIIKVTNKDATMNTGSATQPIPSGQPNWYAVQDAFNYATDAIYAILRGGIYAIPLDFTPNGGVVPSRVGRWAMIIAFCDLLDMRSPDKAPVSTRNRSGKQSAALSYASELEAVLSDIASHKDGFYRQMPEAATVANFKGNQPKAVNWWETQIAAGQVRALDGQFTFCANKAWAFWDLAY